MSELVPVRRVPRFAEGEVLGPESPRERAYADPTYFAKHVYMMPEFEMESRGHQVHKIQCLHRRRCYYYREWTCGDCGTKL